MIQHNKTFLNIHKEHDVRNEMQIFNFSLVGKLFSCFFLCILMNLMFNNALLKMEMGYFAEPHPFRLL